MNFPVNCGTSREKCFSAAYPCFDTKVEIEQKNRREVKNEAVMRLAGEIRQREQVSIGLKPQSSENRNGPSGKNDGSHFLASGCVGERGDPSGASRGQEGGGGGVQGAARDGGEHQAKAALEVDELDHENESFSQMNYQDRSQGGESISRAV